MSSPHQNKTSSSPKHSLTRSNLYSVTTTVGDVTPGYPRRGPKCTHPDRVGRADGIPADSIRTVRHARLQEASSGVGIGPDLPCTARDIIVTDQDSYP